MPIYSAAQLIGKGLQRLSYFTESRYVTRRFKNHLKSFGIFDPIYLPHVRKPIYLDRPSKRVFDPLISNRKFKFDYVIKHGTCKGLRDLPRIEVRQEPLKLGIWDVQRRRFTPDSLLVKGPRVLRRGPARWALRCCRRFADKVPALGKSKEEPGIHGPGQPAANPAARSFASEASRVRVREIEVTSSPGGVFSCVVGGVTVSSRRDLARMFPAGTKFRFYRQIGESGAKGTTIRFTDESEL